MICTRGRDGGRRGGLPAAIGALTPAACAFLLALFTTAGPGATLAGATAGPEPGRAEAFPREVPFVVRPFRPFAGERWIGDAVAYGPHRDGQRPGGPAPSRAELLEDLRLMGRHWSLLRVYGSAEVSDTLLGIIREEKLGMKVMLGAWIAPEEGRDSTGRVLGRLPEAAAANRREVESAIRLAAAYPEIVVAVCVGNETQVSWSSHRVPHELLVAFVREVRARTKVPVTAADDFQFWRGPASHALARELDFIVTHHHPLWNGRPIEDAVAWTRRTFAQVKAVHPGRLVVIGETGWATAKLDTGEQGKLIRGRAGEVEQTAFFDALMAWSRTDSVTTFMFDAFDENWKGGPDPGDVEKHWGLFRADRTPKPALHSRH